MIISLHALSQDAIDLKSIKKEIRKTDKSLAAEFAAIKLIPGKIFILQEYEGHDSLRFYSPEKISSDSFYFSLNEVTNKQYRRFIEYVQDSILKRLLGYVKQDKEGNEYNDQSKKINTRQAFGRLLLMDGGVHSINRTRFDTNGVLKSKFLVYAYKPGKKRVETPIISDAEYWKIYNPSFDNYPVSGVNFFQAGAYCHWKTKQIRNALGNNMKFDITVQPSANQFYAQVATSIRTSTLQAFA